MNCLTLVQSLEGEEKHGYIIYNEDLNVSIAIYMSISLVPRLLLAFQRCTGKMREPGKTYHVSDVAGGTDLTLFHLDYTSQFHPLRHSHDKFYLAPLFFSCNVEKLGGAWVRGYMSITLTTLMQAAPATLLLLLDVCFTDPST